MEKNPQDRFASAHEVYDALEQVRLSRRPVSIGNLPQTSSTRHENEIAQIITVLGETQLVTLLNDNVSLALAVGGHLTDQFTDGVWMAQLESAPETAMVLETVMSVLDAPHIPDRPPVVPLIESLREKIFC